MATASNISPMPQFQPKSDPTNTGARWTGWLERFETYLIAADVTDDARKRALLLYQAGSEVYEIFKTLPDTGESNNYTKAKDALTKHFEPAKNPIFEIYNFREAKQRADETLDEFHTRLRTLAKYCQFHDTDFEIKMQIVCNGKSNRLRRKALRDSEYNLADMLIDGRKTEVSSAQAMGIEENFQDLQIKEISTKNACYKCGLSFPHINKPCPARQANCSHCGVKGHFAKMCRKPQDETPRKPRQRKPAQGRVYGRSNKSQNKQTSWKSRKANFIGTSPVKEDSSSDDNYAYAIENKTPNFKHKTLLRLNESREINFLIDTGATVDVVDNPTYQSIKNDVKLEPTKTKIFAYGSSTPLKLRGCFQASIESKSRYTVSTFYVVEGTGGNLLSAKTAQDLSLIQLINTVKGMQITNDTKHIPTENSSAKEASIPHSKDEAINKLLSKHKNVFIGEGKIKGQRVKLHIQNDVTPVLQPQRMIPYHMRKAVSKELNKLIEQDIIEKVVDQPTPWISPIVCVPKKDGGTRICVDMREANKAIVRERHIMPTLDDFKAEVNGSKYFSKIDLKQAYHQVELEPDSRFITTFSTHEGLFQYKRLSYGTSSSAELFQNILQRNLSDIKNVKNIADDIIIFGKNRKEHDTALGNCLQRLSDLNIKAKASKCSFLQAEVKFYGLIFTEKGTRPDPERVSKLQKVAPPQNVSEVRSFLGMANTCSDYIPNYASLTLPLRELTKKDTKFKWTFVEQKAFNQLKQKLTQAPVIAYFDTHKRSRLIVDGSPKGISAILAQKDNDSTSYRIISYASRALSPVESRYSQTDIEGLALVWGVEHFRLFLLGADFDIITDHKALEAIFNNPRSKPPARIERWIMRLQPYNFHVIYKTGSTNEADYLSRHPIDVTTTDSSEERIAEEYVNYIIGHAVPKSMSLEEIQKETKKDRVLQKVQKALDTGDWDKEKEIQPYKKCMEEITSNKTKDILMKGNRIIIPEVLKDKATQLAHIGHQGIEKTKSLLREKIWYPNMSQKVKELIEKCSSCQAVGISKPVEPMQITPTENIPWYHVGIDFLGPIPNSQQYLLVVIDKYTKFPEVEIVHSTSAQAVIPKLDRIFATHGIPVKLTSDNGPPFNGTEFERYMKALNIDWKTSTPLWPQGNANVENFNKTLSKVLQTANLEERNWRQELQRFLLSYRATPHTTTKIAPSELLYNRKIRGFLPQLPTKRVINKHREAKENIERSKARNKKYYDRKHHAKKSNIKEGDIVICLQKKSNKLTSKFSPERFTVIQIKGTRVVAKNKCHIITRNISHFKKVPRYEKMEDDDEDTDSETKNRDSKIIEKSQDEEVENNDNVSPRRSKRSRIPIFRYGTVIPSNVTR